MVTRTSCNIRFPRGMGARKAASGIPAAPPLGSGKARSGALRESYEENNCPIAPEDIGDGRISRTRGTGLVDAYHGVLPKSQGHRVVSTE